MEKLPVYKKDGFLFFKKGKEAGPDDGLIVDVARIGSISAYLKRNGLDKIVVNSSYFEVDDLSFLKYLPFVKRISIVDDRFDIQPVNDLHELQELRVGNFNGIIDFDNFPNLEVLGIVFNNKLKNLENAVNLRWLWLDFYKDISLEKLKNFSSLTYLYLNRPAIRSLIGISGMSSLIELHLDTASKLETLDGFAESNKNLKWLDVYQSRKLDNYDALKYLGGLEILRFTKTGDMKDIKILRSLPHLKEVILGIKVIDGDMLYLKNIEKYGFINFSHYNFKN
ncbi:MAG: hypothetical protein JST32_21655 [Bacteroidetes bacterium]|nr:hypothetical protein [Bacteroidota bacterium]